VVFQWPCGAAATSRCPRRIRPMAARHVGRGPGLVDEHQSLRVEIRLLVAPDGPRCGDIRLFLLGCMLRLFVASGLRQ
jgi:hypothetical protein